MKRCPKCGARTRRTGVWWHGLHANQFYVLEKVCPKCLYVGTERVRNLPRGFERNGTPAKLYRLRQAKEK